MNKICRFSTSGKRLNLQTKNEAEPAQLSRPNGEITAVESTILMQITVEPLYLMTQLEIWGFHIKTSTYQSIDQWPQGKLYIFCQ